MVKQLSFKQPMLGSIPAILIPPLTPPPPPVNVYMFMVIIIKKFNSLSLMVKA